METPSKTASVDQKQGPPKKPTEPLSLAALKQLVEEEFDEEETVFQFSKEDQKDEDDTLFLAHDVELLPEMVACIRLLPPEGRRELFELFAKIDAEGPMVPAKGVRTVHVAPDFNPLHGLQQYQEIITVIKDMKRIPCSNEHCPNKVVITSVTKTSKLMHPLCDACLQGRAQTPPI